VPKKGRLSGAETEIAMGSRLSSVLVQKSQETRVYPRSADTAGWGGRIHLPRKEIREKNKEKKKKHMQKGRQTS